MRSGFGVLRGKERIRFNFWGKFERACDYDPML